MAFYLGMDWHQLEVLGSKWWLPKKFKAAIQEAIEFIRCDCVRSATRDAVVDSLNKERDFLVKTKKSMVEDLRRLAYERETALDTVDAYLDEINRLTNLASETSLERDHARQLLDDVTAKLQSQTAMLEEFNLVGPNGVERTLLGNIQMYGDAYHSERQKRLQVEYFFRQFQEGISKGISNVLEHWKKNKDAAVPPMDPLLIADFEAKEKEAKKCQSLSLLRGSSTAGLSYTPSNSEQNPGK